MNLKEITLAELLNSSSGTDYFVTFAKLIGKTDDAVFYEGISDDDYYLIEELEEKLGYKLPSHYLEFLSYLNGGHFLEMDLFSLTDMNNIDSLYNRNFINSIREEITISDSCLIIGKYKRYVMCVDCLDEEGSYTLMDIRSKEVVQFENFNALIGFILYIILVDKSKKRSEEIEKMKEKLKKEQKKAEMLMKELVKKDSLVKEKISKKALKEQKRGLKR